MAVPKISTISDPPSRAQPSTFSVRMDATLGGLPGLVRELNAFGAYLMGSTFLTDVYAAAKSSPLPLSAGGTGATDAAGARTNLGLKALASLDTAPVNRGGTGATDAAGARNNLGLKALATLDTAPISRGGTGATTADGARTALGLGTAATRATGTSGDTVPMLSGANTWAQTQTNTADVGWRAQRSAQTSTIGAINYGGRFRSGLVGAVMDLFVQSVVNGSTDGVLLVDNGAGQNAAFLFNPVSGNATALKGNWVSASDERLKALDDPWADPVAMCRALRGRSWTRRDTGGRGIGLIAQDVEAILPEFVERIGQPIPLADGTVIADPRGIDTGGIGVAIAIEALKVAFDRIDALEATVAALSAEAA